MLTGRLRKSDFAFIVDKVNGRLAGWKEKLLNTAGRVTLAKSVVAAIPIYSMQHLWLPSSICDTLDSCVRRFVWGGPSSHWVPWHTTSKLKKDGGLGLRKTRETNVALLGKKVWDMIHSGDKLWVQLLSSKYLKDTSILHANCVSGSSHVWQSIMKAMASLKDGFSFRVGKGEISLWYDRWIEDTRLCDLVPYVDIHDVNLRVCDVWYNNTWHWDDIITFIPPTLKMKIMSHFVDTETDDTVIWGASNTGRYSFATGYTWLTRGNVDTSHTPITGWAWIWKLKLPENIKFFLWQTLHEAIPSNAIRARRHVTNDPSCQRCGSDQETIIHTLRDCSKARVVWAKLPFHDEADFYSLDCLEWINHYMSQSQNSLFATACWIIWKARNSEIFNDVSWSVWFSLNQITCLHMDIVKAFGTNIQTKQPRLVQWHTPPEAYIKLNVDGSSLGNPGRSGFGGILRDMNGEWVSGFSGFCGYTTNINAELLAIYHGLRVAWDMGFRLVICESDSQVAISLVTTEVDQFHPHANLINSIKRLTTRDWTLVFTHTLRKGNECADWFAKTGASSDVDFLLWDFCPQQLHSVMLADAIGVHRLRF